MRPFCPVHHGGLTCPSLQGQHTACLALRPDDTNNYSAGNHLNGGRLSWLMQATAAATSQTFNSAVSRFERTKCGWKSSFACPQGQLGQNPHCY